MRGSLDAWHIYGIRQLLHQLINVFTEPIAHDPAAIAFAGKRAGAHMNGFRALALQDFAQVGHVVARAMTGKYSDQFTVFIIGKRLLGAPKAFNTVGQRASLIIFFAADDTNIGHFINSSVCFSIFAESLMIS